MAFNIDEEGLKSLFYYTSDGVIILDSSLNIEALNPSAGEITGWNMEEMIGKKFPVHQLIYLNSSQNKANHLLFNPSGANFDLEMEVTLGSGNKVLLPAISFPITTPEEKPCYGLILENVLLKYGLGEKQIKTERLDELTGLYHKTFFEQAAEEEIKRMRKHGGVLGALLVQIGNLAFINQSYGKAKANEIVKKVGEIVKGNSRDVDLVGRFSEDEIMVLLIHSDNHKMNIILKRLKEKFVQENQTRAFPVPVNIKVGKTLMNHDYEQIFNHVKLSLENFI
ncbi:MAG: diguanylate cyclase [Nitrospirae bacterium]|nr:diguanylate cyclase [Nitrospirota bacterium]MBI3351457.1 diguanylate cyclase [Nitrospirota bacterium]